MSRLLAVLALLAAASPAVAQPSRPPSATDPHSIPWFLCNPGARHEALRLCRDDYRLVQGSESGPICANAETAEARALAARQRLSMRDMDTPAWWTNNPHLRSAALAACSRRADYDRHLLRYCEPARRSAGQE